jgi:hypothetical protein
MTKASIRKIKNRPQLKLIFRRGKKGFPKNLKNVYSKIRHTRVSQLKFEGGFSIRVPSKK